jgi:hypothetical protein
VSPPHAEFHVQVIYAYPAVGTPDVDRELDYIRDAVRDANGWIQHASLEQGGPDVDVKVACNGQGEILVDVAPIPGTAGQTTFSNVMAGLQAQGYDQPNEKYWVLYDGGDNGWAGTATMSRDDSPGRTNSNNLGPDYAVQWGHVSGDTWVHELMHTMGAVQPSAPNHYMNRGGDHCDDERDIMCYGQDTRRVCSQEHLDCNHDDYFDPTPEPGSYLATHWNIASDVNRFLARTPCQGDVRAASPDADTCPAAAGTGETRASHAAASANGSSSSRVAASGSGSADGLVAATGTGEARGTLLAAGAGDCNGVSCQDLRRSGPARGYHAGVSGTDEAACEGPACLAASGTGEARCETTQCVAAAGDGSARCEARNACAAASLTRSAAGTAAASGAGDATGAAAASGAGAAEGSLVAASGTGTSRGSLAAASGTGDAEGTLAVSVAGDSSGLVTASLLGDCNDRDCYDASPTGPSSAELLAVSATGDSDALVAVSIVGDSDGTVAASGLGSADGPVSFSGCDLASYYLDDGPCPGAAARLP